MSLPSPHVLPHLRSFEKRAVSLRCVRVPHRCRIAFTLLELLVAATVMTLILLLCLQLLNHYNRAVRHGTELAGIYREGNSAMALVGSHLRLATLDPRQLQVTASGEKALTDKPTHQANWSDLMLISGPDALLFPESRPSCGSHALFFQAALGDASYPQSGRALNEIGYYLDFNTGSPPAFVTPGINRLRLMQYRRRPGAVTIYDAMEKARKGEAQWTDWFTLPIMAGTDFQPVANNVLAFLVVPKVKAGSGPGLVLQPPGQNQWATFPNYYFNSQATAGFLHQKPDLFEITMVIASEESIARYASRNPDTRFDFNQAGLFGALADGDDFAARLNEFLGNLDQAGLNYRVFNTIVRAERGPSHP